jgi:hypothetical protein
MRAAGAAGACRTLDVARPEAGPLRPLEQSRELCRREPHHAVLDRRPAELAAFQTLRTPVPSHHNSFTRSARLLRNT